MEKEDVYVEFWPFIAASSGLAAPYLHMDLRIQPPNDVLKLLHPRPKGLYDNFCSFLNPLLIGKEDVYAELGSTSHSAQ